MGIKKRKKREKKGDDDESSSSTSIQKPLRDVEREINFIEKITKSLSLTENENEIELCRNKRCSNENGWLQRE